MSRPDYRRIHKLEYELGFREDPPPPSSLLDRVDDRPGAVIYYRGQRPTWDERLQEARESRVAGALIKAQRREWLIDDLGVRNFLDD